MTDGLKKSKLPEDALYTEQNAPLICTVHSYYGGKLLQYGDSDWKNRWGAKEEGSSPKAGSGTVPPGNVYVYELQLDLMRLGYLSNGRGFFSSEAGKFDKQTAGAVIALKWDLIELYGVECCDSGTWEKYSPGQDNIDIKAGQVFFDPAYSPSPDNKGELKGKKEKRFSAEELKKLSMVDRNTTNLVKQMTSGGLKDKKSFLVPIDDELELLTVTYEEKFDEINPKLKERIPSAKSEMIPKDIFKACVMRESHKMHARTYIVPKSLEERIMKERKSVPAYLKAGAHKIVIFGLDWYNASGNRDVIAMPGVILKLVPGPNFGWVSGRGWGITQYTTTTESGRKPLEVKHVRGLPVYGGGDAVIPGYIKSCEANLRTGIDLFYTKFELTKKKRDCTFDGEKFVLDGNIEAGKKYQCAKCLKKIEFPYPEGLKIPKGKFVKMVKDDSWTSAGPSDILNVRTQEKLGSKYVKGKKVPVIEPRLTTFYLTKEKFKEFYGEEKENDEDRWEYPCSWPTAVIRYAGWGPAAWYGMLQRLALIKYGILDKPGKAAKKVQKKEAVTSGLVKTVKLIDENGKPLSNRYYVWAKEANMGTENKLIEKDTPDGQKATKTNDAGEIAEKPFDPKDITLLLFDKDGGRSVTELSKPVIKPIESLSLLKDNDGPLSMKKPKNRGPLIAQVKKMLTETGYSGLKDSETFDKEMQAALSSFQKSNVDCTGKKLTPDGVLGALSADTLNRTMVGISYYKYETPKELSNSVYFVTITKSFFEKEGVELSNAKGCSKVIIQVSGEKAKVILKPVKSEEGDSIKFLSEETLAIKKDDSLSSQDKKDHRDEFPYKYRTELPLLDVSGEEQSKTLSANLTVKEFAKGFTLARIDPGLIEFIQAIRDSANAAIRINSGYRSYKSNYDLYVNVYKKNAPTKSPHTSGMAADIGISGYQAIDVAKKAIDVFFDGGYHKKGEWSIGLGIDYKNSYCHVDLRDNFAVWSYGADEAKKTEYVTQAKNYYKKKSSDK